MAKSGRRQRCVRLTDELWAVVTKASQVFGVTKSVMVEGLILTSPAFRQLGERSTEEMKRVAEELKETLAGIGEAG